MFAKRKSATQSKSGTKKTALRNLKGTRTILTDEELQKVTGGAAKKKK